MPQETPNIFKQLRQDTGLSINSLANLAGVSRFYIIKLEDLLYDKLEPSSAVARVLSANVMEDHLEPLQVYGIPPKPSPQVVADCYSTAVRLSRLRLTTLVPPVSAARWEEIFKYLAGVGTDTSKYYPHELLRKEVFREYNLQSPLIPRVWDNTSQVHYCKMTNIHPALISKYESGGSEKMAPVIREALERLQVIPELIEWCDIRTRSKINYLGGPTRWGNAPMEHIFLEESLTGDD